MSASFFLLLPGQVAICVVSTLLIISEVNARIKLAAPNFEWWFMGVLGKESPILANFAPRSPKSNESATHPEVKFRVGRASVIACLSIVRAASPKTYALACVFVCFACLYGYGFLRRG